MKKISCSVFLFFLLCSTAFAIPVSYQITGSYLYMPIDGIEHVSEITGMAIFEDEFKFSPYFSFDGVYGVYGIPSFSLSTSDGFAFSGGGTLVLEAETNMGEPFLTIKNVELQGTGDWTNWYTLDVQAPGYDYSDTISWTSELPPIITASSFYPRGFAIPGVSIASVNLTFSEKPVPEPASLLLIGIGLSGIAVFTKRRSRKII